MNLIYLCIWIIRNFDMSNPVSVRKSNVDLEVIQQSSNAKIIHVFIF